MISRANIASASRDAQVFRALLAPVRRDFERYLGSFAQVAEAGLLDGRDMDEDVFAASVRLDEAVALGPVKPLNRPHRHVQSPRLTTA
jgi:hypothetical protein